MAVWDEMLRLSGGVPALEALRTECQLAAWPLASGSFWFPADAEPACELERLAASIFRLHTAGRAFDRAKSGAEWWANVSRSETVRLEHAEITTAGSQADTHNTYCQMSGAKGHPLRHEPCAPHQTYGQGHETPFAYIGDFNDANAIYRQSAVFVVVVSGSYMSDGS